MFFLDFFFYIKYFRDSYIGKNPDSSEQFMKIGFEYLSESRVGKKREWDREISRSRVLGTHHPYKRNE